MKAHDYVKSQSHLQIFVILEAYKKFENFCLELHRLLEVNVDTNIQEFRNRSIINFHWFCIHIAIYMAWPSFVGLFSIKIHAIH